MKAAALYHSANPWEGEPYAQKVAAVWPEEQRRAGFDPPVMPMTARLGMVTRMTSPFPAHQPPRMLPMGGPRPSVIPGGMRIPPPMQADGLTAPMVLPRIMPPGMMQAGVAQAGGLMPAGMMQAGASPGGAPAAIGHGLAFYRAAPVGTALFRRLARGPYGLRG